MLGGKQNTILCGVDHNIRKILARFRALLRLLLGELREVSLPFIASLWTPLHLRPLLSAA